MRTNDKRDSKRKSRTETLRRKQVRGIKYAATA